MPFFVGRNVFGFITFIVLGLWVMICIRKLENWELGSRKGEVGRERVGREGGSWKW